MREIKFRAWDKLRNEFLSGGKLLIEVGCRKNPTSHLVIHLDEIGKNYSDRFNLEQFTGLLDEKGIEIYEGDVVSSDYYMPDIQCSCAVIYSVDDLKFTFDDGEQDAYEYGNLTVIGNIHQNPELLQ